MKAWLNAALIEMQRYKTISDWASSSRKSKLHLPSDDVNNSAIWH